MNEQLPQGVLDAVQRGHAHRAQLNAEEFGERWQNRNYRAPICAWEAVSLDGVPDGAFILQIYPDGRIIRVWEAAFGAWRGGWFEHGTERPATRDDAYNYIRGLYAKDGVR